MSNKILDWAATVGCIGGAGAVFIAAAINEPSEEWKDAAFDSHFNPTRVTYKIEKDRMDKEAEALAMVAAENLANEPDEMNMFRIENGYTKDQCEKCLLVDGIGAEQRHEISYDFNLDSALVDSLAFQESSLKHTKNGSVVESPTGASGEFQITKKGFNDVWAIYTGSNQIRYKEFLKENSDAVKKYAHLFSGNYKDVLKKAKKDPLINRASGITLFAFYKHREKGDVEEASRDYFAGESGKMLKDKHEPSKDYAESVMNNVRVFKTCNDVKNQFKAYQDRFAKRMDRGKRYHQWKTM